LHDQMLLEVIRVICELEMELYIFFHKQRLVSLSLDINFNSIYN